MRQHRGSETYIMDKESEKKRAEILSHLSQTKFIGHREPAFFHGYHYIMI